MMKTPLTLTWFILFWLTLACLRGCSTVKKIPEVKPTPTSEIREVTLKFDAKTCQYEGPDFSTEGDLTITLLNESEYEASIWIVRIDDGRTWQDMLNYIGAPGSNVHPPPWSSGSIMTTTIANNLNARIYSLKQGLYAICCCTCGEVTGPRGVWPGAPLEVKEDNSSN